MRRTTAHKNGMRVDMTLASGWPYGGPHVSIDQAAGKLVAVAVDVAAGADSVAVPSIGNGEKLIAVFTGAGTAKNYDADKLQRLRCRAGEWAGGCCGKD